MTSLNDKLASLPKNESTASRATVTFTREHKVFPLSSRWAAALLIGFALALVAGLAVFFLFR